VSYENQGTRSPARWSHLVETLGKTGAEIEKQVPELKEPSGPESCWHCVEVWHDRRFHALTVPDPELPVRQMCGNKVITENVNHQIDAAFTTISARV
jgi:hypothetical protein